MTFPLEALDQHIAVLGKTGSGKSYATRGLVEKLLDAGRRVCVLDYTGVWWGLRSNASGKHAGYPAIIFGGDHADVPLADGAGPIVAKVVATGKQPVVIDLDGLTVGAQQRFVTSFLEELYRLNKTTLHLVIEEADEFAPQTGAPGAERMIGATCRIFQRGRKKGFRAIAVTQRPANIHKRVLTQCNSLIAMRLPAPQDQKAVAEWIKGHGDDEKGKEVIASLAKLQRGTGWVWAPEQDILTRTEFPAIKTFDSMRAPEDGDDGEPATWADIDLAEVRKEMASAIEEAKANDPRELKAALAKANADIAKLKKADTPTADPTVIETARVDGYERGRAHERAHSIEKFTKPMQELIASARIALKKMEDLFLGPFEPVDFDKHLKASVPRIPASSSGRTPDFGSGNRRSSRRVGTSEPHKTNGGAQVDKPLQKIIDAIKWWNVMGVAAPSHAQVGFMAGYSHKSGTWATYLSRLRSLGLIEGRGDLALTETGEASANLPDSPPTGEALRGAVMNKIDGPLRRILEPIIDAYPSGLDHSSAGEMAGYSHSSGTWATYLSRLRTLDLIDGRGELRAQDWLFP